MAKKNLQRRVLDVSRISSINVLAGILFVGPDPPIPSKIFFSSFLILNFSLIFSLILYKLCLEMIYSLITKILILGVKYIFVNLYKIKNI